MRWGSKGRGNPAFFIAVDRHSEKIHECIIHCNAEKESIMSVMAVEFEAVYHAHRAASVAIMRALRAIRRTKNRVAAIEEVARRNPSMVDTIKVKASY